NRLGRERELRHVSPLGRGKREPAPAHKKSPLTIGRELLGRDLDRDHRRVPPASAAHQVSEIAAQTTTQYGPAVCRLSTGGEGVWVGLWAVEATLWGRLYGRGTVRTRSRRRPTHARTRSRRVPD